MHHMSMFQIEVPELLPSKGKASAKEEENKKYITMQIVNNK